MKKRKANKKIIQWYQVITCSGIKHFAIEATDSSLTAKILTTIKVFKTHFEEAKKHQEAFHRDTDLHAYKPRFYAMIRHHVC